MIIELLVIVAALPIFDWAARWQIENAFAFGLGERRHVPVVDYWRIAMLACLGIVVAVLAIRKPGSAEQIGIIGIFLVIAYFSRIAVSARLKGERKP